MATRKKYETKIRCNINDEILGDIVWVGSQVQKDNNMLAEGIVVKEHPTVMVKFDGQEPVTVNRDSIWIRNPQGRNGRPVR